MFKMVKLLNEENTYADIKAKCKRRIVQLDMAYLVKWHISKLVDEIHTSSYLFLYA